MSIDTVTVGLIILPFSIKHITVNVPEFSYSMSFVILPLSFIPSTVWPDLDTPTMTDLTTPLSFINSSIFESIFISKLEWKVL
jgi:hypothetical protein